MPHLLRVWTTEYVDAAGKRCPRGAPGAVKRKYKSRRWYGAGVPGLPPKKRIPLSFDRAAAQRMLDDLCRRAERGQAGIADDRPRPLAPLLDDFAAALARRAEPTHVREVVGHARHVLAACKCETVADLSAPGLPARAEAAVWAVTRPPLANTPATAAKYGKHARQFTKFLWRKLQLIDRDPLAGIDLPAERATAPRRDLTPAELSALFAATAAGGRAFRGLDGEARLLLYLLAAATGFRAGELARLTPDRFALDADPPTVRPVPHGHRSKTKEGKPQPLPPAVAERLRPRVLGTPAGRRVWPGTWHQRAAAMLRRDLAAAGIPAVTEAGEAVFHSLRHSFSSLVVEVSSVRVAQELVRHADPSLTIGRYAHATEAAKADAVARMRLPLAPPLAPADGESCKPGERGVNNAFRPTTPGNEKTPGETGGNGGR